MIRENNSRSRLTLRSKVNGRIVVQTKDGPVVISVSRSNNGSVELMFDAPRNVQIMREEILDARAHNDIFSSIALTQKDNNANMRECRRNLR